MVIVAARTTNYVSDSAARFFKRIVESENNQILVIFGDKSRSSAA